MRILTKHSYSLDTDEDSTPRPIEEAHSDDAPSTSPETIRAHQSSASSSSWWEYVGWKSSPPLTPPLPAEELPTAETATNLQPGVLLEEPPPAEATPAPVESTLPAVEEETTSEEQAQRAESVLSSETANSSSWYAPWTWYGLPPKGAPPDATADGGVNTKTESEMVKEEALARDSTIAKLDAEVSVPAPAPALELSTDDTTASTSPKPPSEPTNPVESTFTTYSSGWASFFSSRRLVTKTITNEEVNRDENGVEVMEVDIEEVATKDKVAATEDTGKAAEPPSSLTPAVPKPIANIKDKEKKQTGSTSSSAVSLLLPVLMGGNTKDDSSSSQRKDSRPPSPKPETIKSDKGEKDRPPPPLTISDSVKQSVKKSSQPSPSPPPKTAKSGTGKKGSGTNSPSESKTIVPNLILPTWEDTFRAPPRNAIPPTSSGSRLARTIKFVSGVVLGDAADANASTPLRDKDKEKEKEYVLYGRALPRSWDVINPPPTPSSASFKKDKGKDKMRQTDVLRGCKRVVVIGIHGWFPGDKVYYFFPATITQPSSLGAVMRTVLGEPTGTSSKFVSMMVQALEEFQKQYNVKLDKITSIPLEGEGTINKRVERPVVSLSLPSIY